MGDAISNRQKRQYQNLQIHKEFMADTLSRLREFDVSAIPGNTDKFAVIIEPRPHPDLEYVLRNVMYFLGPEWGLLIVAGPGNKEFLTQLFQGWGEVTILWLNQENLSREEFRNLRKSAPYWRGLKGKQLVCFETDSIMCKSGIDAFLDYDYIGAPWAKAYAPSDVVRVGNGGFSLRSKQAMIDMCMKGKADNIPSEDAFFSIQLNLHKEDYKLPDVETAKYFSVESIYHPSPLAIHKPWSYLTKAEILTLYDTIHYG